MRYFLPLAASWLFMAATTTACPFHTGSLNPQDYERALRPRPPSDSPVIALLHPNQHSVVARIQSVVSVLNKWMVNNIGINSLRKCNEFSLEELNVLIASLINSTHPELQNIYSSTCNMTKGCDRRKLRLSTYAEYKKEWSDEATLLDSMNETKELFDAATAVLRSGKCFESIMLFQHHLSSDARLEVTKAGSSSSLRLPFLPDEEDAMFYRSLEAFYIHSRKRQRDLAQEVSNNSSLAKNDTVNFMIYHSNAGLSEAGIAAFNKAQEEAFANVPTSALSDILEKLDNQTYCQAGHTVVDSKFTKEEWLKAGLDQSVIDEIVANSFSTHTVASGGSDSPVPDTTIKDAGYVDCNKPELCEAGADRSYSIQAVVRAYTVAGSGNIIRRDDGKPISKNGTDVIFHTRTFEALPGSTAKWGPDTAGGDGTLGMAGPAIVAKPGQKLSLFVRNNLGVNENLGVDVLSAQDYFDRMEVIRDGQWTPDIGAPSWVDSDNTPADKLTEVAGNVPGLETKGFDVFNIHLHGLEVSPHLFHPMGTSNPNADWISISPNDKERQCYCYKFHVAETQSRGDFLYHTHRHGTSSVLTWAGMFGWVLTDDTTVTHVREGNNEEQSNEKTLVADLVRIADNAGLEFDDEDINFVLIYDTTWQYKNDTDETQVILSDLISAQRGSTPLYPFFVNGQFQPTLDARTGALTVLRVACISANHLCQFSILEGEGTSENSTIIPFDMIASDGITYKSPVHRRGNGNPLIPDISKSEAYLSMGGGMREVILVQFPRPGQYTVWQRGVAPDDSIPQLLMHINVTGVEVKPANISDYNCSSARPPIPDTRLVSEYRGLSFNTMYNQEKYPFPYYGVGDINGKDVEPYKLERFDIGSEGGTCAVWVIRSMDVLIHPFHIHVNPFVVLSTYSELESNNYLKAFIADYTPPWDTENGVAVGDIWRDTVMVPPLGMVVIKQCYDAGVRPSPSEMIQTFGGKFVFHCHFLLHEDTGLIHNMILGQTNLTESSKSAVTDPETFDDTASESCRQGSSIFVSCVVLVCSAICHYFS